MRETFDEQKRGLPDPSDVMQSVVPELAFEPPSSVNDSLSRSTSSAAPRMSGEQLHERHVSG